MPWAVETLQPCCDPLAALPVAMAVHCQLNPQARPFVPTAMAPTLAYRRGKREEGKEPVSKHQIRSGNRKWAGQLGVGLLNPRREAKLKGKNGDRARKVHEKLYS